MRTLSSKLLLLALLGLGTLSLQSCEQEGPAEAAGEQIDEAARNAGDAANDFGNRVEDACEEATNTNC